MSDINWRFPPSEADQFYGFNDAGIENFAGDRIGYLGREIAQNSLDARIESPHPVELSFKEVQLEVSAFPGIDAFRETVEACRTMAKQREDTKAEKYFANASKLLKKGPLKCLRIDDYNTTGLRYDAADPYRSPFYVITKARGMSAKASETAAGSFGIGHSAPFAVSSLRTVLYSTQYEDASGSVELFQGKSILMSHKSGKKLKQGTGFYGIADSSCGPLLGEAVPERFRRVPQGFGKPQGTTIYVLGFEPGARWEEELKHSLITNFFMAIKEGGLAVEIGDDTRIGLESLGGFLNDQQWAEKLNKEKRDKLRNTARYYQAVFAPTAKRETQQIHLGLCRLSISVSEGDDEGMKGVAMTRNGMFITDRQPGLIRFGGHKNFAAVFQCEDEEGNKLLRAIEPPKHDAFEPDRLATREEKKKAETALDLIVDWITDKLKEFAGAKVSEATEIELSEFLPSTKPSVGSKTPPDGERDLEGATVIEYREIKRKPPAPVSTKDNDAPDKTGEDPGVGGGHQDGGIPPEGGDGKGGPPKDGHGGGEENRKVAASKGEQFPVDDIRVIPSGRRSSTVHFTPRGTGEITLELQEIGETPPYEPIDIKSSDSGKISAGKLEGVEVAAGERVSLEVAYGDDCVGAVRVVTTFGKAKDV